MKKRLAALSAVIVLAAPAHAAPPDLGIVLMHGKWGTPASLNVLARDLEVRGYRVSVPETAWSGQRLYDVDYPAALKEIEAEVKRLHERGAKRVVVAGQSLGANAVVAYAFSRLEHDALALFAPGHMPERGMGKRVAVSVDQARQMVAAGRGAEKASFEDVNQGKQRTVQTSAANYLSYFDPEGLGAMTRNIAKIGRAVPLFLAIGTDDLFYGGSKPMFDSAPAHPASRYVTLEAGHFDLPAAVSAELLKWLAGLEP